MPRAPRKITRARASRWFRRNFPRSRIESRVGDTFFLSHDPAIVCVRYYGFKFVNPYHPMYDPERLANASPRS
jgi:hypothetical protein